MGNTAESHAMQSQSTQLYKRAVAGTTLPTTMPLHC